jgi:hypothetical protein
MSAGGYESWFVRLLELDGREAGVELVLHRPGHGALPLSSSRGAYEYGTREPMPGITPQPLPEG